MKKRNASIIFISIAVIGVIILSVGLYYYMIKAGIPYQDPTPEMLQRYNSWLKQGEVLSLTGMGIIVLDVFCLIVYRVMKGR
ncbi:MAG: hypothetical protein ACI4AA_02435 [Lachnospiraceae bacterium]